MAKAPTKKTTDTKVTRITASDAESTTKQPKTKPAIAGKTGIIKANDGKTTSKNPFARLARYFKGAWQELRQVRWPDRKNTWAMTGALLAFTVFFIVVIVVLDFAFSELFKLILGSN